MDAEPQAEPVTILPDGEYAIVEIMGHSTLVGRISEVDRFGTKMLAIEPLFGGTLLPAILQGGASIYRLTPCTAAVALKHQPTTAWQLPQAIRCIVPPLLLEAADNMPSRIADITPDHDDDPDDERPF